MKKILSVLILFIILMLAACETTSNTTTEEANSTTTSTSTSTSTTTTEDETTTTVVQNPFEDECAKAEQDAEANWIPVWCDEFDYSGSPHPTKWNLENKGDGFGNNELQYYTPRLDNAKVEDGELTITVKKENYSNRNYTSAKLMSRGKGDFLYGKIEVRAKLPEGRGTWPAIWMMPTNSVYGGWPNSGEIDIMEHVGYDMDKIHGTIHTGNYNHSIGTQKGKGVEIVDVVNYYHRYAIEWDPTGIKWFVDGQQYYEFKNDEINNPNNSSGNWPFDQEFYLILNVAFGGNWGGAQGIDPNFTESRMIVDYVRVFEKDYESIDEEAPQEVGGYEVNSDFPYNTKISWDKANDDVGISHYEIYLDDEYIDDSSVPTYVFTNLDQTTNYELKVIAVDFTGKKSEATIYSFISGEYLALPAKVKAANYVDMLGIQTENTSDSDGGKNVGYIDKGDYLTYKLNVSEAGNYNVKFRVAAMANQREILLYNSTDVDTLFTTINFDNTNGWQNWITVDGNNSFYLEEGIITIKVQANTNNFNINWFEFIKE